MDEEFTNRDDSSPTEFRGFEVLTNSLDSHTSPHPDSLKKEFNNLKTNKDIGMPYVNLPL